MDEDKYPSASGRRRFIKGLVGSSALATVGTAGTGLVEFTTNPSGVGGGSVQAKVIENVDGPAPRGMSQVPLEIEDGYLKGIWPGDVANGGSGAASGERNASDGPSEATDVESGPAEAATATIAGVEYSSKWFQYCGVEGHPKLEPGSDADNFLRSDGKSLYTWQSEVEGGAKLTVDQFADYEEWHNGVGDEGLGKPAAATWRSEETDATMPVQVIRSPRIEELAQEDDWLAATTERGFIAWLNKCTHFCCVPSGFKQTTTAENEVYCQCHQSVYDPFSVTESVFKARPRPTE